MADRFQNRYRIPSARATWHDYDGGMYFITICTAQHESYFGSIISGELRFSVIGQYLNDQIKNIRQHYPYAEIPLYVIMPNHVHLVVCIDHGRDGARTVCETMQHISLDKQYDSSDYKDGARTVSIFHRLCRVTFHTVRDVK